MKTIDIRKKLEGMDVALDGIIMGDFDFIGEFTAKRDRKPHDENYKRYGAFFRSNYERGILIYYLIRQFNLTSMLEIGFGRGYGTFCAARAFHDAGIQGRVTTIDPALDENYVKALQQVFPKEWFSYVTFMKGTSAAILPTVKDQHDLIYIDGDHSYQGTKSDWEMCRDKGAKLVLMDDYHLPAKNDPGIQCREAIDQIDWNGEGYEEPELVIMDRRMFFDDRRFTDEQIDYGQVLFTKKGLIDAEW